MRAVFGPDAERRASTGCAAPAAELTDVDERAAQPGACSPLFGPDWLTRSRGYREAMGPVEEAVMAEVRRRRAEAEDGRRRRRLDAGPRPATRTARR